MADEDGTRDRPPALARLERAQQLLAPAREILDRFNYKHKNQHRLSKWWAAFDTLRRHTAKLEREHILPAADALERGARRSASKRARVPVPMPPGVEAKAKWMSDYLVPKTYLAFTQLAADNQFAHLGLLLLGLLAQVHDLTSMLLPPAAREEAVASPADNPVAGVTAAAQAPSVQSTEVNASPAAAPSTSQEDIGVAVSRDDTAANHDIYAVRCARDEEKVADALDRKPKKAKRKPDLEAPITEEDSRKHDGPSKPAQKLASDPPPAKAKAKKRLDKDIKETRKKKRKKGDEFDDLFSSLM